MRLLGMPVVPPVSKTYTGLPLSPWGIQRWIGPPRSHSSSNSGNFFKSSKLCTSFRGSNPSDLAFSSQKGEPVAGLKCHSTISRTCASRRSLAAFTLAASSTESVLTVGLTPARQDDQGRGFQAGVSIDVDLPS